MSDTDNAYRAGAACAGEKYAGRIRELDTKLTEALAQVATLREKASALLEWCNDHFDNNGSDWSSTSAPGHACDDLDAALADTDAAAREHDAAIRDAALEEAADIVNGWSVTSGLDALVDKIRALKAVKT